jgi:heterodisulfide reductase subunit B
MMKFSYYPGCSLHSTGKEYGKSTKAVCKALDIELEEIVDWNCCGASAGHSINHKLYVELNRRNLSLAQKSQLDIAVPCSACYNNLKQANEELNGDKLQIKHLLEIFYCDVGIENIEKMVKKPLQGLKVAPYYGCLITRPPQLNTFDSVEQPQSMDKLLTACGCEVVPWAYKTDCCGAGLSLSQTHVVIELVRKLITMAKEASADCIVTACPLCQTNIELRQNGTNMPVFYFTELLGIAFGMKAAKSWLKKHLVNPMNIIGRLKILNKL